MKTVMTGLPRMGVFLTIFLLSSLTALTSCQNYYDQEKTLRTAVLTDYQHKIRPDKKVSCNIRLSLLNINLLDVPSQSLSVSGWLTVQWNDSRLVWDPAAFGNINDIYDTELVLWKPEIIVDNSVSNLGVISNDKLLMRVTSEGEMTWEPSTIFETHCDVDVTYYPFDTQVCQIQVTSWAYTLTEVDLQATDTVVHLEDFSPNGEWDILDTWNERRELLDGKDLHSQIDFHIQLRRKPRYYVMTILIPVIVTSVLCVLVFLLPSESGEKVGYTLTILLTYTVMLTLVAGYMPPTSKTTSVLSVYLTIILFVGVVSTFETVFGLFFHHHSNAKPVPPFLNAIFRKVLIPFVRWKKQYVTGSDDDTRVKDIDFTITNSTSNKIYPDDLTDPKMTSSATSVRDQRDDVSKGVGGSDDMARDEELTWQDLAVIMDAFFFRIMGVAVLVLTAVVLISLFIGGYTAKIGP